MQVQTANRNASRELQRGFFAPLLIFPSSLSTSFLKNGTLRAFLHSHYLPWLPYPPPPPPRYPVLRGSLGSDTLKTVETKVVIPNFSNQIDFSVIGNYSGCSRTGTSAL